MGWVFNIPPWPLYAAERTPVPHSVSLASVLTCLSLSLRCWSRVVVENARTTTRDEHRTTRDWSKICIPSQGDRRQRGRHHRLRLVTQQREEICTSTTESERCFNVFWFLKVIFKSKFYSVLVDKSWQWCKDFICFKSTEGKRRTQCCIQMECKKISAPDNGVKYTETHRAV